MPHTLKDYRTIILPSGKALMFYRLSHSVMCMVGYPDCTGLIQRLLHYKIYSITPWGTTQRKVRRA